MNELMTMKVKFNHTGGPEVLSVVEEPLDLPQGSEVLIRHHAIGVNFVDTYYRSGLYPATLPSGLGSEAAGTVEAVGDKVEHFKVGDRVAYATGPLGSYSLQRVIDEKFLVKIPDEVSFEQAASVLLKGLTVHYLFHSTYPLKRGQQILFHASAGGVGLIACQWARSLGVQLIGTVSSSEKAQVSKEHGAWQTIDYTKEDVAARVMEMTNGHKLPVVYDGVGKSTWEISLDCLRPRGVMVSFGNASGPVTGVDLSTLAQKGSLYVTRPILAHYTSTREELTRAARDVFALVLKGIISTETAQVFSLEDVKSAHYELNNRKRAGTIILKVAALKA
jgi:NADPH2:quinone reductase